MAGCLSEGSGEEAQGLSANGEPNNGIKLRMIDFSEADFFALSVMVASEYALRLD